jgi:hypothetical protein
VGLWIVGLVDWWADELVEVKAVLCIATAIKNLQKSHPALF